MEPKTSRLAAAEDRERPRPFPREEIRAVVFYIIFASAWIIVSDMVLDWVHQRPMDSYSAQTCKGLKFVLTTALLLYLVLRRSYNRWRRAEEKIARSRRQLRALTARLQTLREDERARIAREIHDDLGQMLTALKMDLRWIERRLSQTEDARFNPLLDKVVEAGELADATIAGVQRISSELRPGLLDNLGLSAALRHEARRFQERASIPCRIQCPDLPPRLDRETATTAFRIFQEALTNVARHAQATEVTVELGVDDGQLRLRVTDNGRGVNPANLDDPKSLGLLGMKERADLLGGELEIAPGLDGGTVVSLVLPLETPETQPQSALALA